MVVFADKGIKPHLLGAQVLFHFVQTSMKTVFQAAVHSFVPSVLFGMGRLNTLRANAQVNPPFRQVADTAQCG